MSPVHATTMPPVSICWIVTTADVLLLTVARTVNIVGHMLMQFSKNNEEKGHSPPNVPQHSKDTQRVLSLLIIIYVISLTCVNTFITSNYIYISHEDKYNHKSSS